VGVGTGIAKRVGGRAAEPLIDEAAARLGVITRDVLNSVVRNRGASIAADADMFRLARPDLDAAALARALIRERSRRGGASGLATGLPSLFVGVGTAVEVAAALADAAMVTYNEVSLVLALAHLRGRDLADVEARRLEVLLAIGMHRGAVRRRSDGMLQAGSDRLDPARLDALPEAVVGRINRALADRVIAKVVRRRAAVLAGRLLPFGVGVAVATVEDFRSVGGVGRTALKLFDLIDSARSR
jgi:hypothetical protein